MPIETEKKFLVSNDTWRSESKSTELCQGYIHSNTDNLVRIRIAGDMAFLTIKGKKDALSRPEFEYEIPMDDARFMLENMANKPLTHKIRHVLNIGQHTWEVDEFLGDNKGLIVAEIELEDVDEDFERPTWLGKEVSYDKKYRHRALAAYPFKDWTEEEKQEALCVY